MDKQKWDALASERVARLFVVTTNLEEDDDYDGDDD